MKGRVKNSEHRYNYISGSTHIDQFELDKPCKGIKIRIQKFIRLVLKGSINSLINNHKYTIQ